MSFLNEREEIVLRTIIEEYINSNEPIGSRNVSKVGPLKMSPASIRNIMSDLVDKGFIVQPHTSSGRVPTDDGYRYYIDRLISIERITPEFLAKIKSNLELDATNFSNIFKSISKRLSELTGSIGFIVSPKINSIYLKNIEFIRLNKETLLAIIVTKTGIVHNVLIPVSREIDDNDIVKISNYINDNFNNHSLSDIKMKLLSSMATARGEIDNILQKNKAIGEILFSSEALNEELYFSGTSNILDIPEIKSGKMLKELLNTFDEKKLIVDILERCMTEDTVQIFVGSEIGLKDINEMGMVIKPYHRGGTIVGTMGVIGPKRMRYSEVAAIVDCSSQLISKVLTDFHGGDDE